MHSVRILAQFKKSFIRFVRINKGMHFPNHFKINNCSGLSSWVGVTVTMWRVPGSLMSPWPGLARRGFLAAEQILIPVLYCPLPNGDNDTLINTGPSIPIIGKWYPHNKWDSYCFFSQPLTKTNPAGPKFDHGQYWVLWGIPGRV